MEAYNSLPKAKLTKEEIFEFISCVYNYLIPEEERSKHESLIVSSIKNHNKSCISLFNMLKN